ncbi:MAG: PAS domain-containing protein, partial [Candidatus Roizmanbacteria bacterium]|nr:PAS domain-containing protein [Candidatus Roizmanbacteria bacterium]
MTEAEELKKYKLLLESIQDTIFVKDLESRYIFVNQKGLEIFGNMPHEKVLGKNDYEFLPPEQAKINIEDDQLVFKTGKPNEVTMHVINGDEKKRWFHTIKIPQFDDKGKIISLIGIVRNITEDKNVDEKYTRIVEAEKKRAEELENAYAELQGSKDELVRSEKLAYTGRIAAGVAHEIRNPLTNVIMAVQQLKKAICKPESTTAKHIEIVERNTERINYLITELLNCARPPKLDIQLCDIHMILRNILESIKSKIRLQRIKVVKEFISDLPKIMVDRNQIERVFLNIVLNAVEAMPKGGKLTITTELKGSLVVLKIQDT